jgi:hypothetical protein
LAVAYIFEYRNTNPWLYFSRRGHNQSFLHLPTFFITGVWFLLPSWMSF